MAQAGGEADLVFCRADLPENALTLSRWFVPCFESATLSLFRRVETLTLALCFASSVPLSPREREAMGAMLRDLIDDS